MKKLSHLRKRGLAIFLALIMCLGFLPTPTASAAESSEPWDGTTRTEPKGKGTQGEPYLISNGEELAWVANSVNTRSDLQILNNTYYLLVNNIDLGNHPWTPIGNNTQWSSGSKSFKPYFGGKFIGDGYTIKNLNVSKQADGNSGLFGYVVGAIICDMTIEGATVTGTNAGAFVGSGTGNTKLCNLHVKRATITATENAGGIVGSLTYSSGSPTVCDSSMESGTVTAPSNALGHVGVGGIVGFVDGGYVDRCRCEADATISAYKGAAGGIVGKSGTITGNSGNTIAISDCYNRANVTVETPGAIYTGSQYDTSKKYLNIASAAGGIAGYIYRAQSTVKYCYNTGNVTVAKNGTNAYSYAGGIVGYDILAQILNCANMGTVRTSNTTSGKSTDVPKIGVISGYSAKDATCRYLIGCLQEGASASTTKPGLFSANSPSSSTQSLDESKIIEATRTLFGNSISAGHAAWKLLENGLPVLKSCVEVEGGDCTCNNPDHYYFDSGVKKYDCGCYCAYHAPTQPPEPAKHLTNIEKNVLTAVPIDVTLTLPKVEGNDITLSYPSDGKLTVAAETDSVTLLYEITVTGQAGAAFTVTDEDAVLVGKAGTDDAAQENAGGPITGTIADGQTAAILYVVRTFSKGTDGWNISNTAYLQAGNEDTVLEPADDRQPGVEEGKGLPTVPVGTTVEESAVKPEPKKLTKIEKELVEDLTSIPSNANVRLPLGKTLSTKADSKYVADAQGTVTLMYKITVTGEAGAAYQITDDGAIWVGGEGKQETSGKIVGIIGEEKAEIYVIKTYEKTDVDTGTVSNTASLAAGDNTTGPADDEDATSTAGPTEVKQPDGPVNPKLQSILKAQVNPDQLPDSVTLPNGMTCDSFVTVDGKLKFPEGAETVNVLYRITVVGEKGAKYTVTDEGATWISGGTVDETATSLTVTGTLASSMEDIYVYKTFSKNDSITNTATLKPTDDSTDPADGADDNGEISTPPVVTPVETETPDTREPYQMTIQKLVNGKGNAEVTVGDKFTYMVVLDNTGKNKLYQLKITDTMAAGLELVDVSSAFHRRSGVTELVQLTATTSEDKLESKWTVEEFGPGDEVVLVYQATATTETGAGETLNNNVQATAKKNQPVQQRAQIRSSDDIQVSTGTTVTSTSSEEGDDISVGTNVPVTVKPGSGGGDDPNPPQPTTPDAPTTKDDITGDVSVKVYCTTTGSSHSEKSYELMNGGFTAGEVAGNKEDGYTCEITINPGSYVAQYGNGHWVDDSQTPNLSVTLTWNTETEKWNASANATVSIPAKCLLSQDAGNYTVEHYKETLDGDYELAETDTLSAKYGEVTATPRSYTGFTYANGHQDEVKSGEVSATNAPVLKLYYSRNTYTVSYVYEGERPVDAPDAPEAQEVKYGETVTVENAPTSVKGMFSGWDTNDANVSGDSFEMPANNVTFTGTWEMEEPPVDPEIPPLADSVADLVAEIGVNLECTTDESHNRDSVEVKYSFTDDGEGNGTITISPRSYLSDMPSHPAHGLLDVNDVVLNARYVEDDNGESLDDPASQEPTGHWELDNNAPNSITFRFLCVPEEEGCDHTVGEDGYCKEPGCDHGPDCPNCHGPAPVEPVAKYTVTYTDGVTGEEVFANQVYTVEENAATPAFDGTPSRDGYQFAGWDPAVADTVTDNVVYTAKWSHTDADHRDDDHDGKCDFCGECMHHKDGNGYCTEEGCDHDGGCCPKPSEEPEEKTYRLTIQYIYTNGQTASASHTADLKAGESYSVTSPSISGFTPSQTVMSGTMGEGNETYTVVYSRNATTVTVTWRNWDGTVLDQAYWVSNEREPAYSGRRPTRPDSGRYTYTFAGWGDREVDENGNVTYTAQFDRERIYDAGTGGGTGGSTGGGTGGSTTTTPPATIPDNPSPLDPGTTIDDQNVPLAGAVGLNATDHFAYINGYEDDTVRPMKDITRAEVAAIFFRLMTEEYRVANWATENTFSDVKAGDWYNNAISTCVKAGIIKGYEDGTFRPGQSITRAEFAAIAARFLGPDANDEGVGDFADTANKWYSADVRKAAKAGWISGMGGNRFEPDAKITRAQVMSIVNRMLDRTPDADHMLPEMKKWTDNPEGTWYYADVQEATNGHDYTRDETNVETWTAIQAKKDWVEIEAGWAANNGASTPAAAVETQGLPDGI